MKFGHLIENNKRNFFFDNHAENEAGRLVPDFFLFFKRSLIEGKSEWFSLYFTIFPYPSN